MQGRRQRDRLVGIGTQRMAQGTRSARARASGGAQETFLGPQLPGERIVGIREDDGDIAVHTIACEVWARLDPPESKLIDLSWNKEAEAVFGFTQVIVTVRNEIGVLSEVAAVIARYGVSIANIKMRNQSSDFVDLSIDLEVKNERQLVQMLAGLRTISTVVSAERREKLDYE